MNVVLPTEYARAAQAIRAARGERDYSIQELEANWRLWVATIFREYVSDRRGNLIPFANFHEDFWEWVWAIDLNTRPQPFLGIWPRGAAKSTSAEMALAYLAATRKRKYALYICESQDQADDHISNIASMLESPRYARYYPEASQRKVGKFGNSKGWRRNRLRTGSDFTIDAIGLDTAARGAKMENARPDLLVIDDIDAESDSEAVIQRKIQAITRKLLPAGASNMATLGIQNLVHLNSIFSRLAEGSVSFLADRVISGPFKALNDMRYELDEKKHRFIITGGTPNWVGQDIPRCQELMDDIGLPAFLQECQQEVEAEPGGMFDAVEFGRVSREDLPEMVRVVVKVDPAVTDTQQSDSHGLVVAGLGVDGIVYALFTWEQRTSPLESLKLAITEALFWNAETVGIETDQGGETWDSVYREAWRAVMGDIPDLDEQGNPIPLPPMIPMRSDKAGAGAGAKTHRASKMLVDYQTKKIKHLWEAHVTLERALRRFPRTKPYDLVDAMYWAWADLTGQSQKWNGWLEHARREVERLRAEREKEALAEGTEETLVARPRRLIRE